MGKNPVYGPIYSGTDKLGGSPEWASIAGITQQEKTIISAMCENEGNLNAVQSYDSEVITAGAMQKTMTAAGTGQLPVQIKKFKDQHPDEYFEYFEQEGWFVDDTGKNTSLYYQHPDFEGGLRLEGDQLKKALRKDCTEAMYTTQTTISCRPVSSMACAIALAPYVRLQIKDFAEQLREVVDAKLDGYTFKVGELFRSELGRAAALDEYVNRPKYMVIDVKLAVDKFFENNSAVSKDLSTWGARHAEYECQIVELYGENRPKMTDSLNRYKKLKGILGV